jgi:hypothetical protein
MDIKEEVSELLGRVPLPPDEPSPTGLGHEGVVGFVTRTGLAVPPELEEWLHLCNGARAGPGGLFGIRPVRQILDIEEYYRLYPHWRTAGWIPTAGDGCGDYYVLSTGVEDLPARPVFFIDTHECTDRPAYVVASDLWRFLRFLLGRELGERGWPFDQTKVLAEDPDLAAYRRVPKAWEV